jgi:hypothetical protein
MTQNREPIGAWIPEESDYPHEHETWRNVETGNVLVVEEKREPWLEKPEFYVRILPETKEVSDSADITTVKGKINSFDAAREYARERMAEDTADEGN